MLKTFRTYLKQDRGNVAVICGLTMLAMAVLVAGAVDMGQRESTERHVQAAVDAAALSAIRHSIDVGGSKNEIKQVATASFKQNIKLAAYSDTIQPDVTVGKNRVTISVKHDLPTNMLSLANLPTLPIRAKATAAYGAASPIEAVLVLDLSGSMEGDPLIQLREAATQFTDSVLTDGDDSVKIAMVPFTNMVKVGLEHEFADWIDVPPAFFESEEKCEVDPDDATAAGCYLGPTTCTEDGVDSSCTDWICPGGADAPANDCETEVEHNEWYGCVESRASPMDLQDDNYAFTPIPADMSTSDWACNSEILPLTSTRSDIDDALDELKAEGDTYLATGIMWGQRVLSSRAPFDQGENEAAFEAKAGSKIMIIMSDGANTRSANPDGGSHWWSDIDRANDQTRAACAAAVLSGTRIYAIAFNVENSDTLEILEDCAENDPTRFFEVSNSLGLNAAFGTIGSSFTDISLVD